MMQDLPYRVERVWPLPAGGTVKVEVRSGAPIDEAAWPILRREAAVADAVALVNAWKVMPVILIAFVLSLGAGCVKWKAAIVAPAPVERPAAAGSNQARGALRFKVATTGKPGRWIVADGYGVHVAEIARNEDGVWICYCYEAADWDAAELRTVADFIEGLPKV